MQKLNRTLLEIFRITRRDEQKKPGEQPSGRSPGFVREINERVVLFEDEIVAPVVGVIVFAAAGEQRTLLAIADGADTACVDAELA